MTDRERHRLHGPVSRMYWECAFVDPQNGDWGPPRPGATFHFDRAGREEGRVKDQGATITTFDAQGLRTTVSPRGPRIPRQAGLEYGLCMDANMKIDFLTHYDSNNRPVEVVYRDPEQKAVYRILLEYDDQNRIRREQVFYGEVFGGTWSSAAGSSDPVGPPTPEQLEEFRAALRILNPDGVFTAREYEYDSQGRVARLFERMPPVSEHRRSFAYDVYDNVVEEHYESTDCDAGVDDEGRLSTSNETHQESWNRYEYRYDDRGNWIEKVSFHRVAPDRDFHRSGIERRTIEYHDPP
jgi:YD repeat-containing protein